MSRIPTRKIAVTALFSALSLVILLAIPRFPLFLPFLEYDFADVPIIILTMFYGPVYGLIVTAIVCIFQGFLLSSSGYLGVIMHFVATGTFVVVFGSLYRMFKRKYKAKNLCNIDNISLLKRKEMIASVVCAFVGVLAWTGIMIPFNILITPVFMGVARELVYPLLLPAIIPFNLVKSAGNSALALFLYYTLDKVTKGKLFNKLN